MEFILKRQGTGRWSAIVSDDGKEVGIEIHHWLEQNCTQNIWQLSATRWRGWSGGVCRSDKKDLGPVVNWRFLKPEEIVRLKHFGNNRIIFLSSFVSIRSRSTIIGASFIAACPYKEQNTTMTHQVTNCGFEIGEEIIAKLHKANPKKWKRTVPWSL